MLNRTTKNNIIKNLSINFLLILLLLGLFFGYLKYFNLVLTLVLLAHAVVVQAWSEVFGWIIWIMLIVFEFEIGLMPYGRPRGEQTSLLKKSLYDIFFKMPMGRVVDPREYVFCLFITAATLTFCLNLFFHFFSY